MSMAANMLLINSVKEKFAGIMLANVMEKAIEILWKTLSEYSVERITSDDPGKDYMLDAYISSIAVEGKAKSTLTHYRYEIERMLKSIGVPSWNISAYHIRNYLAQEKQRGISDSTIRGNYQVYNAYFGWLHRDGLIKVNPMNNINPPKVPKKVMEVYSELDIEKLKQGCKRVRDKAIVYLLKSSGCRISEITNLNRNDIDFLNREFVVLGKGNKERSCYMDMVTASILKEYLDSRKDNDPALFLGVRKERLLPDGIRTMLKNLGKSVGVSHVHPHKFRRTEATEWAKRGMPIEQIQKLLGHEKIDTTIKYVMISKEDMKTSYRKFA